MKDLILTIIAGIIFIAFTFNLQSALLQSPIWLALGCYGAVSAGFIIMLLRFIKNL
jgi:hypothetical protein